MYTVVNSQAYEDGEYNAGMDTWKKIGIGIDVLLAAGLIALKVLAIRKYKRDRGSTTVRAEVKEE